ncbi:hypothetical protein B0H10DRAFT_2006118 [Mycena sp. CBHHK59/15]|nr:hypothetical protein B0H10DRAFT_2006118 [Mycena sp. CBHHK59/15]
MSMSAALLTLRDVDTNIPTSRKHAHEESSDDDNDVLTIADVLQELHKKFPALDYPQYADALKEKGIIYATSVLDFDNLYYKDNVGMADGAIGQFVKRMGKMVKAAKKRNGNISRVTEPPLNILQGHDLIYSIPQHTGWVTIISAVHLKQNHVAVSADPILESREPLLARVEVGRVW